jgi:pimeloyl-ACP methyl ester carboxylesterase
MSMSTQTKPSVVFAHGLFADGSCYSKLIPTLQAEGHEVVSAQNSLDSLEGDIAAVKRALGRVSSPAVLVGHSQGRTIITHAGTDDRVAALVYICALAPDEDETAASLQAQFPQTDVFKYVEVAEGRIWLLPDGIGCFAGDLTPEEQQLVWATQGVPAADMFDQKGAGAAWKSKPSCYVLGNNDQTVNPELQRFVSQRMGATVFAVDSSHVPMLSHPDVVLDAIRSAANSVQASMSDAVHA